MSEWTDEVPQDILDMLKQVQEKIRVAERVTFDDEMRSRAQSNHPDGELKYHRHKVDIHLAWIEFYNHIEQKYSKDMRIVVHSNGRISIL